LEVTKVKTYNFTNLPALNFTNKEKKEFNVSEDIQKFIYAVNEELKKSQKLKKGFIEGKDIPVYEIMIQSQKAKISLELLTKVRDEALKAYNAVINMRI
jgi:flagellar hook-basal body complex protein FliE